jgi:hypothetical protein
VQDAPSKQIWRLMEQVFDSSRWMFGEFDMRVGGLVEHREQRPWPECLVYFPKRAEGV